MSTVLIAPQVSVWPIILSGFLEALPATPPSLLSRNQFVSHNDVPLLSEPHSCR